MVNQSISYARGQVEIVFNSLSSIEKEIIQDFEKYLSISSNENKIKDFRRDVIKFRDIVNKNFDKIELKDLRDFLSLLNKSNLTLASKNQVKSNIKRFIRYYYKNWSERFNELEDLKLIRAGEKNEEKLNSSTLLTKDEIEKLVKNEPSLKWKTFFITLYESGFRPVELRLIRWKDVNLNIEDNLSEINIYSTKTKKARTVYVKESTYFLKELKKTNEAKNEELVFPSFKEKTKPMDRSVVSTWLKKLSFKVIGREVNPYLLRHTRATELYTNAQVSDSVAQKIMGHKDSMKSVYTHLSSKDVKEASSKVIYNLDYLQPEKKHKLELEIEKLKKDNQILQDKIELVRKYIKDTTEKILNSKIVYENGDVVPISEIIKKVK